jgi:hypothetical protein
VNSNGIVGKPAVPTLAPGGRVAVAAAVGVAVVEVDVALEEPEALAPEDDVEVLGAGVEFAELVAPPVTENVRRSTRAPLAADWSW